MENRVLTLLEQCQVIAEAQAKELDDYNIMRHKALKTVGVNSLVHHLRLVKELIEEEAKLAADITIGGKTMHTCVGKQKRIGSFAKVYKEGHELYGWTGIIVDQTVQLDDCSGDWMKEIYEVEKINGERFKIRAEYCVIV